MSRNKHQNKEIEKALKHAESQGWVVNDAPGHASHRMYCPKNSKCRGGDYCGKSIWSTPRNPAGHARQIRQIVDKCEDK